MGTATRTRTKGTRGFNTRHMPLWKEKPIPADGAPQSIEKENPNKEELPPDIHYDRAIRQPRGLNHR